MSVAITYCKIFLLQLLIAMKNFIAIELDELSDSIPKALHGQPVAIKFICNNIFFLFCNFRLQ